MKLKMLLRGIPPDGYIRYTNCPVVKIKTKGPSPNYPEDVVLFIYEPLNGAGYQAGLRLYTLKRL